MITTNKSFSVAQVSSIRFFVARPFVSKNQYAPSFLMEKKPTKKQENRAKLIQHEKKARNNSEKSKKKREKVCNHLNGKFTERLFLVVMVSHVLILFIYDERIFSFQNIQRISIRFFDKLLPVRRFILF